MPMKNNSYGNSQESNFIGIIQNRSPYGPINFINFVANFKVTCFTQTFGVRSLCDRRTTSYLVNGLSETSLGKV